MDAVLLAKILPVIFDKQCYDTNGQRGAMHSQYCIAHRWTCLSCIAEAADMDLSALKSSGAFPPEKWCFTCDPHAKAHLCYRGRFEWWLRSTALPQELPGSAAPSLATVQATTRAPHEDTFARRSDSSAIRKRKGGHNMAAQSGTNAAKKIMFVSGPDFGGATHSMIPGSTFGVFIPRAPFVKPLTAPFTKPLTTEWEAAASDISKACEKTQCPESSATTESLQHSIYAPIQATETSFPSSKRFIHSASVLVGNVVHTDGIGTPSETTPSLRQNNTPLIACQQSGVASVRDTAQDSDISQTLETSTASIYDHRSRGPMNHDHWYQSGHSSRSAGMGTSCLYATGMGKRPEVRTDMMPSLEDQNTMVQDTIEENTRRGTFIPMQPCGTRTTTTSKQHASISGTAFPGEDSAIPPWMLHTPFTSFYSTGGMIPACWPSMTNAATSSIYPAEGVTHDFLQSMPNAASSRFHNMKVGSPS